MSKSPSLHPVLGEIYVSRSARARRISIRVSHKGEVTLVCPCLADMDEAYSFLDKKIDWVRQCVERARARRDTECTYSSQEVVELKRQAASVFTERIRELACRYGFRYKAIRIGMAYTKWGSCSTDNVIMISAVAVGLPPHLRDFLILHELCHTVHHNHSARFHALLDACCDGREKEYGKELRNYHTRKMRH